MSTNSSIVKAVLEKARARFGKESSQLQQEQLDPTLLRAWLEHGKLSYEEGISFERWSDRMIINHGNRVIPYLHQTWTYIHGGKGGIVLDGWFTTSWGHSITQWWRDAALGQRSTRSDGLQEADGRGGTARQAMAVVVNKGKELYEESDGYITFRRWCLKMTHREGPWVEPYLADARKLILGDANSVEEQPVPQPKASSVRAFTIMKGIHWKSFGAGLGCGLGLGFALFWLLVSAFGTRPSREGRFVLSSGDFIYKMDTRTGQTWYLHGYNVTEVAPKTQP
jgi:hypothetical protein